MIFQAGVFKGWWIIHVFAESLGSTACDNVGAPGLVFGQAVRLDAAAPAPR
jgi:hypothetical protein